MSGVGGKHVENDKVVKREKQREREREREREERERERTSKMRKVDKWM